MVTTGLRSLSHRAPKRKEPAALSASPLPALRTPGQLLSVIERSGEQTVVLPA